MSECICLSGAVGVFKEDLDGSFHIPPDMSGEQVENRKGTVKDGAITYCFFFQFCFVWMITALSVNTNSF